MKLMRQGNITIVLYILSCSFHGLYHDARTMNAKICMYSERIWTFSFVFHWKLDLNRHIDEQLKKNEKSLNLTVFHIPI